MRALVQRVTHAEVAVGGQEVGHCGKGWLVLLGVGPGDTKDSARRLWEKVRDLRAFDDSEGKMNLSLVDVEGEVLVVSQFTLYADVRHGRRPSFTGAASPDVAEPLYEYFCSLAERDAAHVGRGVFGAEMAVSLVNDGPVTLMIDTDELSRRRA
jgi:D-tyrosyl-tRNA(Tyr) deacylase